MKYDIAVLIGKFQVWSNTDNELANFAATHASTLAVLCSSYSENRTKTNPLLFVEQQRIIGANIKNIGIPYEILPLPDDDNKETYRTLITQQIEIAAQEMYISSSPNVVFIGTESKEEYLSGLLSDKNYIQCKKIKNEVDVVEKLTTMKALVDMFQMKHFHL